MRCLEWNLRPGTKFFFHSNVQVKFWFFKWEIFILYFSEQIVLAPASPDFEMEEDIDEENTSDAAKSNIFFIKLVKNAAKTAKNCSN